MSGVRIPVVLLALCLASSVLSERAAAQERDSVKVDIVYRTKVEPRNGYNMCFANAIGVHPDPLGKGSAGWYSYSRPPVSATPPEWTGLHEDIPGERITYLVGANSGGDASVSCGEQLAGLQAVFAGVEVWAYYTPLSNEPPTACFNHTAADELLTIDFDASCSEDEDGNVVSYEWDFGDGRTGSGVATSHTYAERGTYAVTLTVRDDDDATGGTSAQVNVEGPAMRYVLTLERAGTAAGKAVQDDEPVVVQVGDEVRARVRVQNTGDHRLENIQLTGDIAGLEVVSDPAGALQFVRSERSAIDGLEPGGEASILHVFEAVHTVHRAEVIAREVSAEAVTEAGARRHIAESTRSCAVGDKTARADEASDGCASLSITGSPLVVVLELEPDPVATPDTLVVGDTLRMRARVRNVGLDPLTYVVPAGPVEVGGGEGSFVPVARVEPDRVDELAPGASAEFVFLLRASQPGDVTIELPYIVARDGDDAEVTAEGDGAGFCEAFVRCGARFYVKARELEVTLRTTTAEGEELRVKSGLYYEPGYEIRPMEQIEQGGSLASINFVCRSSCVDVEAVVVDPADGTPEEGVSVTLSAPPLVKGAIEGPIVTPAGATGTFCDRPKRFPAQPTCGNPLTLETDEDGKINAYYTLPGVVEEVTTTITAVADLDGEEVTREARLTVEPNIAHQDAATLAGDEATLLSGVKITALVALGVSTVGETCKAMLNVVAGPAATLGGRISNPTLNVAAGTSVEFLCSLVPTQPVEGLAGIIKRVSEIVQWGWFLDRFELQTPGIVNLVPRPKPQLFDVENDFLSAVNEAFLQAGGFGRPGEGSAVKPGVTIKVTLYEVSYLDRNAVALPLTRALFFKMEVGPSFTFEKLMTEGTYTPETWLLPPRDQFLNDIVEAARAGETRLTVGGEGGTAGKNADVALQDFQAGDHVVVNPGEANGETNQIIAVEGTTLLLAAPLQHDHAAGEMVVRLAEGTVAPPPPPLLVPPTDETGLAPLWPQLTWMPRPQSFATRYDLQLATDTLFTTLVAEADSLTGRLYEPGALAPGRTYYWRMRASNLAAEGAPGPWSMPLAFTTGTTGVDVEVEAGVPETVALEQNYPNPFNPQTTIRFALPEAAVVRLVVFDALGREVARLVEGSVPAGRHEVVFEAAGLPTGVYLYRLTAGAFTQVRRMLLLR